MTIHRIGQPPPPPPDRKSIFARSGWEVPQPLIGTPRLSEDEMRGWANLYQQRYGAIPRSLSLHGYNCVGMIFACRRAWINITEIDNLLSEDGYKKIPKESLTVGDLVLYKYDTGEPAHIALIYAVENIGHTLNIRVISKWGSYPEFLHFMERVPEDLGKPLEFYTERVMP